MLSAIVRWSLGRPRLVAAFALLLLIYGAIVLKGAKFDVFPDFVPAQAEIQTEAPGLDAEQAEQLAAGGGGAGQRRGRCAHRAVGIDPGPVDRAGAFQGGLGPLPGAPGGV